MKTDKLYGTEDQEHMDTDIDDVIEKALRKE